MTLHDQHSSSSGSKPGVTVLEPKTRKKPRSKFEPRWYVILHDDQIHTYDYVIKMLVQLFTMSAEAAFLHAVEVDTQGVTIVARLPKEKARQKRDEIMHYGGDPLLKSTVSMKASIEPADD